MYQHDIPEKQLNTALDEIVQQCVSFIGVDVNTASIHLLKYDIFRIFCNVFVVRISSPAFSYTLTPVNGSFYSLIHVPLPFYITKVISTIL